MTYDHSRHRERADNLGFSLVIILAAFISLWFLGIALTGNDKAAQHAQAARPAARTSLQ